MRERKNYLYLLLLFVLGASGFGAGFLTCRLVMQPNEKVDNLQTKTVEIYNPEPADENFKLSEQEMSFYYLLQNENDILKLYEINGDERVLIKSVQINSQILPQEDKRKLEIGIKTTNIEEGFNLIEDFSS